MAKQEFVVLKERRFGTERKVPGDTVWLDSTASRLAIAMKWVMRPLEQSGSLPTLVGVAAPPVLEVQPPGAQTNAAVEPETAKSAADAPSDAGAPPADTASADLENQAADVAADEGAKDEAASLAAGDQPADEAKPAAAEAPPAAEPPAARASRKAARQAK